MGIGIDRPFLLDPAANRLDKLEVQRPGEAAGDLVLGSGQVSPLGFEPLVPQVSAGLGVDQLPNPAARPPHAAFEHVADAELAADLFHIDGLALVGKGGAAGDHKAPGDPREISGQIVGDAIGEILLLGIAGEVGKRQHYDRQTRQRARAAVGDCRGTGSYLRLDASHRWYSGSRIGPPSGCSCPPLAPGRGRGEASISGRSG